MPAVYTDSNGTEHYYFPPLPKPQPQKPTAPDVDTPSLKHALHVAGTATTAYDKNPNKANTTAFNNDWDSVQEMIAEQYRLALSSSDPKGEVASLNKQYGNIFHNSNGESSYLYHQYVLPGAQQEADQETPGERNAQIQLYNGLNEPDSSTTKSYDVAKADIDLHLQMLYGDGKDGNYTPAQYAKAEAAADTDFGAPFAPTITEVGTSLQEGTSFNTLLKVLETEGPKLTPAQIKSGDTLTPAQITALEKTGLKLTPAQIAALGGLLTGGQKTLTLTPGQTQLAAIDPNTLALLMTAGIKVPPLSPQMLQIARNSPNTLFYLLANGINISVGATPIGPVATDTAVFNLGHGQQLNVSINGKPLTLKQLPPGSSDTGQPSAGMTPSTVLGIYLSSAASTKASGVVMPGSVAVANLLLGDKNLHLQVTPQTLSNPTTAQQGNLSFLASQADSARPGYIDTQLSSLLAAAPPPGSSGAAAYFTQVINPFLTTQMGGFFSSDDAVNFWNSSAVVNATGALGGSPKSSLYTYLQSWLGTQFKGPDQRQLMSGAASLGQLLTGAPPGLAKMLIPLMEGQVGKMQWPEGDSRNISLLFDDFSKAVQIADQFPALSTVKHPPTDAAATQVANWLTSLDHGDAFYSLGVGDRLYDDTALYGYTDLPNALAPGGVLGSDVQSGENDYDSTLQKQLGTANYAAFEHNKAQVLNGFFGQFSKAPDIGKPISTYIKTPGTSNSTFNKAAIEKAIIAAYGFTPQDLAPVVTHSNGKTVKTNSQDFNIVNIDLAWIQSQAHPGSTVTILPFLFASASTQMGTQTGVFFDIHNPSQKQTHQEGEGRFSTGQTVTTETGPTQVLIDGAAAADALNENPNAWQNPDSSDVKWHYSGYRDFQLNNDDYQNGTIYTLAGNQLGIGPNGAASSGSDFHKEFDNVMSDVVGAAQVAGLVLAPFTGGVSLGITGTLGLVWGTYQAAEGIDNAESHGEQFSLSNPNTRWEFISDVGVAAAWATMGVGGLESVLTRDAADVAGGLATTSDEASTATTAADQPGTPDGVGEGDPAPTTAPKTAAPEKSNTLKALGWTRKALEYGNYALATVQTGQQIQSLAANWDNMSPWQRLDALAGLAEGTVPFGAEPMNELWFGGDWRYSARRAQQSDTQSTPDTVALDTDDTSSGSASAGGPPAVPPTGAGGRPDPLNPDDWGDTPLFFVHTLADGTVLASWRQDANGPVEVDPQAPWGAAAPPPALRIAEIATPDPAHPDIVATNMLSRNSTDDSYDHIRITTDGTATYYPWSADDPFALAELPPHGEDPSHRPAPVLANATFLLDNTKLLIDKIPVEIHEDHITADYSTLEAKRAERIANNLRLDMNLFFEEHFQRELEGRGALTRYARKAVALIHDQLDFASMDPSIKGPLLDQTDLREGQLQQLPKSLESYFPEGSLRAFLDNGDWSDDRFNAFLDTFNGEKGGRTHQVAVANMKVLKQIETQVPYFGGSVEYQQNARTLEYYVYHISTLTRDPNQQYGVDSDQGRLLPRDLKAYRTNAAGKVPFGNLRNLGEGATDEKMTFEGWPPQLRERAEIELNRLRTDPGDADSKQVEWLKTVDAAWQQQSGETPREAPSMAELWNGSNEDLRKHIFSDILRLPWSADHLHGGPGYEQTITASDLQPGPTASLILEKLPSPPDGQPGLVNVAGVFANFLLKPEIASQQYATDPRFVAVQNALEDGTLAELFPGAVPPGDQTLQVQFERLHGDWHEDALANFKPIVGGISGHTLGYMNVYDEALSKVPENERAQYPTPEQVRAIMLAALTGTKRHHSYDEVMSASTATMNDSIPAESYQHPNSYEDVLKSEDPLIRESAEKALAKARETYSQSSNTVLATIKSALESDPKISQRKIEKLTEAVSQYLEGLGGDQAQASRKFSKAVAESLRPNVILAAKEGVKNLRQSRG